MSKGKKTQSEAEPENLEQDSVFDFIYRDANRIALFLSQFDNSGYLTHLTQGNVAGRSKEDKGTVDGHVGIPGAAKLASTVVATTAARSEAQIQKQYDPAWANALSLLDYLTERDLIHRDVAEASIGSLVLVKGTISISDLHLMEKTWRLPAVKRLMTDGVTGALPPIPKGQRNNPQALALRKAAQDAAKSGRDALELFFDMIAILPHTIQARVFGEADVWCSLASEGLTFDPADLSLKYGSSVPGEWHALGILDALPDGVGDDHSTADPDWGNGAEMAVKMMSIIAPITRNMLGRPSSFYGITPLLIFEKSPEPVRGGMQIALSVLRQPNLQ